MWRVVKQVGSFKYWLQKEGERWRWNGLKDNGHKFTLKEEAAKLAIENYSKKADTIIEKV